MTISVREVNKINIVDIRGKIDINSSQIIEAIGWLIKSRSRDILLNFDKVDMVDYSGISILAIAYKNVSNHNGRLKFCNVTLHIEELLKLLRLDSIFEIYKDEKTALKSFQLGSAIDKKRLRRRFKRLDVNINAEFRSKESARNKRTVWHRGKILNLSGDGIFFYTKKLLPLGKKVEINIYLDTKQPIEIEGVVTWLADKSLQPQSYPGMGIQFRGIRKPKQDKLLAFINKHLTRRSSAV